MMKKIFIAGLIVCSFFAVSISSVLATPETHTITDAPGDVTDGSGTPVSGKNYLDIKEVNCTQDGKYVELKLILATGGKIQNSDLIFYAIYLITSENKYDIYFNNGSCIVTDFEQNDMEGVNYSGVGTDTLIISFYLSNSSEEYVFVYAVAYESTEEEEYVDYAPSENIPQFDVVGIPEIGVTRESIVFSANVSYGTTPYAFLWKFGDGKTSDAQNPTHTYGQAGIYKVIVLVTDNNKYADIYYGTLNITSSSSDGNNGNQDGGNNDSGNKGSPSNSGLLLFVVIIAIIVIAGTAIVIYIIRR